MQSKAFEGHSSTEYSSVARLDTNSHCQQEKFDCSLSFCLFVLLLDSIIIYELRRLQRCKSIWNRLELWGPNKCFLVGFSFGWIFCPQEKFDYSLSFCLFVLLLGSIIIYELRRFQRCKDVLNRLELWCPKNPFLVGFSFGWTGLSPTNTAPYPPLLLFPPFQANDFLPYCVYFGAG